MAKTDTRAWQRRAEMGLIRFFVLAVLLLALTTACSTTSTSERPAEPPSGAPIDPNAVGSKAAMVVSWTKAEGDVNHYLVRYRETGTSEWSFAFTNSTEVRINATSLTGYQAQVQAIRKDGTESAWWPSPPLHVLVQ